MMKKTKGKKPNDPVPLIRIFAECKEVSGIWLKGTSHDIEMGSVSGIYKIHTVQSGDEAQIVFKTLRGLLIF